MTSLKYLFPFAGLLFISHQMVAQNDFVVTLSGDTVHGNASIVKAGKFDIVQLADDSKKTKYTAMETKVIQIDNNLYHPVPLGGNIYFMKLLRTGFLSLYGYKIENQTTYEGRLLRKATGDIFDVPIIKFRSSIISFIKDCDSAAQVVKTHRLKRENLEEIVIEYNRCMGEVFRQRNTDNQLSITKEEKKSKLDDFRKLIESTQLDGKSEVMVLLSDMVSKIESGEPIPAYQKNALKDYLKGKRELSKEFEKLMTLLE